MEIKKVDTLGSGDTVSRRKFLEGLSVSAVSGIAALKLTGLTEGSVGLESDRFSNHPFKAIGGYVDNGTLLLPPGCGVSLGQYGNPIIDPAQIHGASLEGINPKIVDQDGLWRNIMRSKEQPSEEQAADFIRGMRIFQVLVKDNAGYRRWDLSAPSFDPPVARIDQDGCLEIYQSGQAAVSKDDRYHLRLVYHEDVNRFDRGAVIGVFEAGTPPSPQDPVLAAELDTPMLVAPSRWSVNDQGSTIRPEEIDGGFEGGVKFIRVGDNLWRYAYENGTFSAECRRHSGKSNEEWESMGQPIFYKLNQKGLNTLLITEPNLGKALDVQTLGLGNVSGHATGIVLWTATDGAPKIERKSLTHLQNNSGQVAINNNVIEWTEAGKAPRQFQIVELRSKPLTDDGTFDLYAVELTPGMASRLPRSPVVHGIGEFDMVQAYRAARALIKT